ncbi:hypothetical protein MAR_031221 [Mya arenaria]|uniref:Uncharacterized protein n=1 Tax=Mya arenaria TaxID=6604 RepID=A0ABY7F376_MYAAR|nr:hypothetical protein MAR_031221 [Mya arenaria]
MMFSQRKLQNYMWKEGELIITTLRKLANGMFPMMIREL